MKVSKSCANLLTPSLYKVQQAFRGLSRPHKTARTFWTFGKGGIRRGGVGEKDLFAVVERNTSQPEW